MSRVRRRKQLASRGRTFRFGSWSVDDGQFVRQDETCTDEVAPGDCLPFTVSRFGSGGGILNNSAGLKGVLFDNWVGSDLQLPGFSATHTFTDAPSNTSVATTVAARTSPSRPVVDIPANLLELGDISRLLHDTLSKGILRAIASNNLRYFFGVKPLVGDLVKLYNFQEHVDRRVKVIKSLAGPKGYRRTVQVYSNRVADPQTAYRINSTNEVISPIGQAVHTIEISGHCRWNAVPDQSIYHLENEAELRALADRAAHALGNPLSINGLASAWEAFPFSWLIDWCVNVQDYLTVHRNIIPAVVGLCSVQRHTSTWVDFVGGNNSVSGTSWTSGHWFTELKSRQLAAPALTAHFPFLSGNQMGILASLAIMRT